MNYLRTKDKLENGYAYKPPLFKADLKQNVFHYIHLLVRDSIERSTSQVQQHIIRVTPSHG